MLCQGCDFTSVHLFQVRLSSGRVRWKTLLFHFKFMTLPRDIYSRSVWAPTECDERRRCYWLYLFTSIPGPSELGSNAMKGYPLLFHTTHSDHVQLTLDKRRANRVESFCKGICFSNRPVAVNERVYIKFSDVSTSWSGVVRFGFTSCNPATINSVELPRYACPDLTNKPGYWAKALPERFAEKDTVLFFYVTRGGDVMYGVNSEENGLFFSGVCTAGPVWALIDIYGNTISVEFVGELYFDISVCLWLSSHSVDFKAICPVILVFKCPFYAANFDTNIKTP